MREATWGIVVVDEESYALKYKDLWWRSMTEDYEKYISF